MVITDVLLALYVYSITYKSTRSSTIKSTCCTWYVNLKRDLHHSWLFLLCVHTPVAVSLRFVTSSTGLVMSTFSLKASSCIAQSRIAKTWDIDRFRYNGVSTLTLIFSGTTAVTNEKLQIVRVINDNWFRKTIMKKGQCSKKTVLRLRLNRKTPPSYTLLSPECGNNQNGANPRTCERRM